MILELFDVLMLQPLLQIYSDLFSLQPSTWSAGQHILGFSIIINTLLLPIYAQMENQSRRLRAVQQQVGRGVARMRRHFRGRELYFYTRAVHRQYGYHPLSAVFGSADLFIQILVFATVYRFLSELDALRGAPFGPIGDLGRPDGLLGGVNLLPLVMTAANAASVFVYVGDARRRLQSLVLALGFLILLYRSPAGLVLYWTANNMFSLARNAAAMRGAPKLPRWLAAAKTAIVEQR